MRRMSTQASSFVIMISILTILVQFIAYYFLNPIILIWVISGLISVICCHILLEQTGTYRICFDYSILTLFISLIVIFLSYQGNKEMIPYYTNSMLGIAVINWLIPMLHCFIRNMLDYGSKMDDFSSFYRDSCIVFLVFYIGILFYACFYKNAFLWAFGPETHSPFFSPFEALSIQIQDYLNDNIPLKDILIYLASRILIYIPYGYFIRLALRRQKRYLRFGMFLVLPALIEILQYFILPNRSNLDDLVYAVIGGFFGCFLFFLTNIIYKAFSGNDFLARETAYSGRGRLHF